MFNGLFGGNGGTGGCGCNCTWIILVVLFLCFCCNGGCGKHLNVGINPCCLLLALGLLYCCGGITVNTGC